MQKLFRIFLITILCYFVNSNVFALDIYNVGNIEKESASTVILPVELELNILKFINTNEKYFKLEILPFQDIVKDPDNVDIIAINLERSKIVNAKENTFVYNVTVPANYKNKVLLSTLSVQDLNKVTNNLDKVNIYNGIYLPGDKSIELNYKTTAIMPIFVPVLIQKFKKDNSLTPKEIDILKEAEKIVINSVYINKVADYVSNIVVENLKNKDADTNTDQYIPSFDELSKNKKFKSLLIDAQKDMMKANMMLMDLLK